MMFQRVSRFAIGLSLFISMTTTAFTADTVKETIVKSESGVTFKIRMEGPYTAEVPLQVVCYFRYSDAAIKKMKGAPVELDRHLGGIIGSLRERGEFSGNRLETLLIETPKGSIKAKYLLLIGLGDEAELSLDLMEQVGQTALRTAAHLGLKQVAFAPLIRDQGNESLKTGDVETAVVRGLLLAYDTQQRLGKQQLTAPYALQEWWVEAGPAYYDETLAGVQKAVTDAAKITASRKSTPYATSPPSP